MPLAIAGIAVVFVGLIAMLLYYGLTAMGKVIIRWTPGDLPVIGNFLKDAVTVLVTIAEDGIRAILLPIVHGAEELIGAIGAWIVRIIGGLLDLGHVAAIALLRIVTVHIPVAIVRLIHYTDVAVHAAAVELGSRIGALRADVHGWLNDLRGWVGTLVGAAVAALSDRLHQLRADVVAGLDDVRTWTTGLVATLAATVGHELAQLRTWTADRIAGVEHDLAGAVRTVEHDLAQGVAAAEHFAAGAAAAAERGAIGAVDTTAAVTAGLFDGLIIDAIPSLESVLATDFPDIGAAIRAIPRAIPTDLAGVLTLTEALALANVRYLEQCGIPNCRNLGGLGHFLQDLLGAAELAALLAMLAEIISDPEGAAHTAVSELSGVFDGAKSLATDLLGV